MKMKPATVGRMRAGRASQTAVLVCTGRAIADHGGGSFRDPTAMALLPAPTRAALQRFFDGQPPIGWRERLMRRSLVRRGPPMEARTAAIDEAVGEAHTPQLVILGAGLDGRAWRMSELRDTVVFEVDHPDTQRDKRARVTSLTQTAREVRFVPVDFTRDRLDDALAHAGHDPQRPTTFIWEGVVMYLTPAEIEATLDVVARRSTPGSGWPCCTINRQRCCISWAWWCDCSVSRSSRRSPSRPWERCWRGTDFR